MQKVFLFLQTTGKKFGCYLSLIIKESDKFVAQNNSVKNINAKQIPKLIEVNSLTIFLSSGCKIIVPKDY